MAEKENTRETAAPKKSDQEKLEPCTTAHTAEASRPDEDEDACDEGVK